jgi:TolB-like protein/DNA-binding winged helix-turn-helix (wHTH) protein/tetratricopeptide (TPR) repeat protein
LDETTGQLTVAGKRHELDRSSHELLRCLLQQSGATVAKEQLLRAGWPGRVVSENSLTKSISRLRQALDDPDGVLLCTVHGYGYRLASRAELLPGRTAATAGSSSGAEGEESQSTAPSIPTPARPERRGNRRWIGLSVVVLALLTVYGWMHWREPTSSDASPDAATTAARATAQMNPSIAVLPFADMSQARDQAYFSDGLADELLDQLAQLPQLRVAGRTSSFSFRGKDDDVASIGRKLNVSTVLEGSVRKSGDRIRITVQLINVADGFHMWSETYDRTMTDLFVVQDDIARSVVAALKLQLMPGQVVAMSRHRTDNPEAYRQWLIGQSMQRLVSPDSDRRAIAAYEQAISLDPKFVSAYISLADVLGGDADYADSAAEVAAGKDRSLKLMDRAIVLDPNLADSYLARADFLYYTKWDWAGAQRDLDTFARLHPEPSYSALQHQSRLFSALGRIREAIVLDERSLEIDPLSDSWGVLGYHHAVLGEFSRARRALKRAYELYPLNNHVNWYIGLTSLLEGKPTEAMTEFDRSGGGFRLAGMAMAQFDAGQDAASIESLDKLKARFGNGYAYQIAAVHAWRGETEPAFAWLDRARTQRDASLIYMKFDPLLRKLHGDPRYRAWLKEMKLPP